MHVDSIKPALKATGTKRLKLRCDELLANVALHFDLRRHSKAEMYLTSSGIDYTIVHPGG